MGYPYFWKRPYMKHMIFADVCGFCTITKQLLLAAVGGRSARIPLALRTGPTKESASPQKYGTQDVCFVVKSRYFLRYTLENWHGTQEWRWMEDDFPFQTDDFQVPAINFPGCSFCLVGLLPLSVFFPDWWNMVETFKWARYSKFSSEPWGCVSKKWSKIQVKPMSRKIKVDGATPALHMSHIHTYRPFKLNGIISSVQDWTLKTICQILLDPFNHVHGDSGSGCEWRCEIRHY